VSVYAPFRLLIAAVTALVIATIIASSSAHAMLLGDAVVRSAPGAPLRVVIPLKPSPGEAVEDSCFRLIAPADAAGPMVTARVSLERAAATPRLVVTTPSAFADPAARFAIESRCGGTTRRNYALMIDPRTSAAGVPTIATAGSSPASSREPGQERLKTVPNTIRVANAAAKELLEAPRAAPIVAAIVADKGAEASATKANARANPQPAPSAAPSHAEAASTKRPPGVAEEESVNLTWYLGAPIAMGVIALGVLFVTRRRTPAMPDWTRGGAYTGPRSHTDMSAQPVTLSRFNPTPMPKLSTTQRPDGASLRFVKAGIAANTLRRKTASDPSTLDTLTNDVTEEDKREERAVREAWAAARRDVENDEKRDEDNAILKAIDEAEREFLFVPSPPDEEAMNRSLEGDLASKPPKQKKAAA
jgi:hypothetical protein